MIYVAGGASTSYALDSDYNFHVWGLNTSGQFLLPGNTTDSSVPVQNDYVKYLVLEIADETNTINLNEYITYATSYAITSNPLGSASVAANGVLSINGDSLNMTYDVVVLGSSVSGSVDFVIRVVESAFVYPVLDLYTDRVLSSQSVVFNKHVDTRGPSGTLFNFEGPGVASRSDGSGLRDDDCDADPTPEPTVPVDDKRNDRFIECMNVLNDKLCKATISKDYAMINTIVVSMTNVTKSL
eukprot:gene12071-15181_t